MPRYVVTMCDVHTQEIHSHVNQDIDPVLAVGDHPWLKDVYRQDWLYANVLKVVDGLQSTVDAILENLGYVTCVLNLDEEIMKDWSAGDSSVSSSQQQN